MIITMRPNELDRNLLPIKSLVDRKIPPMTSILLFDTIGIGQSALEQHFHTIDSRVAVFKSVVLEKCLT
jgi:hypothetical protein